MSALSNPELTLIILAVMVKRLGGNVSIVQADIDDVAYNRLIEEGFENGRLELRLEERSRSS